MLPSLAIRVALAPVIIVAASLAHATEPPVAAAPVSAPTPATPPTPAPALRGVARDPVSGAIRYTQLTSVSRIDGDVVSEMVLYTGPSGAPLAERSIKLQPDGLGQIGVLTGLGEPRWERGIRPAANKLIIYSRDGDSDRDEKKRFVDESASIALDTGLRYTIAKRFDALLAGEDFLVPYASLAAQRGGRVRIARQAGADPATTGTISFTVESSNSRLLPYSPVVYTFDAASRTLVAYRGPSDLPGPDGKPYLVTVTFE